MAESLFGKMRDFLFDGLKEDEEEMYGENYDDGFDEPITPVKSSAKVVNIHPGLNAQMRVSIFEPESYQECSVIAEALKSKKIVMVNLEKIKDLHEDDKIRCFLNGIIYAIDGTASNISTHIMVLAPSNVEIDENMKKDLESRSPYKWYER